MEKHGVSHKPLWNTEMGWPIQNRQTVVENRTALSEEQASAYLARSYVLTWAAGVPRLFWYAWDSKVVGLTDADGRTIKAPARAYAEVRDWMVAARMSSCQPAETETWTCTLARDGGYRGWILWNPERTIEFEIPRDWGARSVRDLQGGRRSIAEHHSVRVGPSPILVQNRAI
jgi:hypothetical protein